MNIRNSLKTCARSICHFHPMKIKKINSNGYGGKVLASAAVFLFLVPAVIQILSLLCRFSVPAVYIAVSLGLGTAILFFLAALLMVEFHQDKRLDSHWQSQRNRRSPLHNGLYECQSCGNRMVRLGDSSCPICGIHFKVNE